MPQSIILQNITNAIDLADISSARELIFNPKKDEKPDAATMGEALKWAAESQLWELVQEICQIEEDNKPDQEAVNEVLQKLVGFATNSKDEKYLDILKFVCEKAVSKPDATAINYVLNYAFTCNERRWDFVAYLCLLKDKNCRPDQAVINQALLQATECEQWNTVQQILMKHGGDKFDQVTVDKFLKKLVVFATKSTDDYFLGALQFICKESTKPSADAINYVLGYASEHNLRRWDIVAYLCTLQDKNCQPDQTVIHKVLIEATNCEQWHIVQRICYLSGDNKPDQKAICRVLKKLIDYDTKQSDKCVYREDFMRICDRTPYKPDVNTIDYLLNYASGYNPPKWFFVRYLCYLRGISPSQRSIDFALSQAVNYNHLKMVQFICGLPENGCPKAEGIGKAFIGAAEGAGIDILRFFWESHTIKPLRQDIILAMVCAANPDILDYFFKPANGFQITQQEIDEAFVVAVANNKIAFIEYALTRNLPSKTTVALALKEAEKANNTKIIDLLKDYKVADNPFEEIDLDIDSKGAFASQSASEIDTFLKSRLTSNLGLKEKKQIYISELEKISGVLQPEQRKSLALYILNAPDHFLKTERHFFRTQNYSNETFSVHQLVKALMQGEQKAGKITIHDEAHHQDYVISRHVN